MSYTVVYERDASGWWVASVKEVASCHTQGRTLKEARRRIREALGLFVSDADSADLVDEVVLPAEIENTVDSARQAREALETAQAKSKEVTERAVLLLAERLSLSVRDTGEILRLSHQRVQQLIDARRRQPETKTKPATKTAGA